MRCGGNKSLDNYQEVINDFLDQHFSVYGRTENNVGSADG